MNIADLQLRVHPGEGLVAHLGGAVVVLPETSSTPAFDDELLALVAEAGDAYGPLPGRKLIRKLAGLVTSAEPDEVGSFAVAAASEEGLALMLCGSMDLLLAEPGHDDVVLSGRDVATWVDRVVRDPFDRLVLSPSGVNAPEGDPRVDLREGVVLGSGITLSPRESASSPSGPPPAQEVEVPSAPEVSPPEAAAPPGPPKMPPAPVRHAPPAEPEAPPTPAEPAPVQAAPAPASADSGFVSIALDEPLPADDLRPLPRATIGTPTPEPTPGPESEPGSGEIVVQGISCSRGHFNDPKARFCGLCGISMVHQTHDLRSGPRPPLGVLVLDDGATYALDQAYVIGREPEGSELVQSGEARPLMIDDPELRLSRVHTRILLKGWDVLVEDAHSANGTRILRPDSSEWIKLDPDKPAVIAPGTRIGMSDRELIFDSHYGAGG